MRFSKLFIQTYKDIPADATLPSHQLMYRAGLIQKSGSGLYNYSPLMMRVIEKVTAIIREELNKIGCQEIYLTVATPSELWKSSDRWDELGDLMVQFKDRTNRELCLSPTNEEAVVDYFKKVAKSYKQLPVCLFQINTKFRDEIRPRFGVMRAREFSMKDAYSFHTSKKSLDLFYDEMYAAYQSIFNRMGLDFIAVEADAGAMAEKGAKTHEFQVLSENGEDELVVCREENVAMNTEMAVTKREDSFDYNPNKPFELVETPDIKTIKDIGMFLSVSETQCLKSMVIKVKTPESVKWAIVCCIGDDEINLLKLCGYYKGASVEMATENEVIDLNLVHGFIGPVNISSSSIDILVDDRVDVDACYITGANKKGYHFKNVTISRDVSVFSKADIRYARKGDVSIKGNTLEFCRGIEVGHVFQLGNKYTQALKATVLDENGKSISPIMGCYGIGVGRAIAAVIEQCHDDRGIQWPLSIAPFKVIVIPVLAKSEECVKVAELIYQRCLEANIEVIIDDRKISPGVKFKDADLIGFPYQLIVGKSYKDTKLIEVFNRISNQKESLSIDDVLMYLKNKQHQ